MAVHCGQLKHENHHQIAAAYGNWTVSSGLAKGSVLCHSAMDVKSIHLKNEGIGIPCLGMNFRGSMSAIR